MRRLLSISLLALLLAPGAASAEPDKLPELAGTTVVEGSSNAFVDVALPKKITASQIFRPELPVIDTEGFYVRVSLRRRRDLRETLAPSPLGPDGFTVESLVSERYRSGFWTTIGRGPAGELEPGVYRLYVHTPAPARLTLKIPELKGARVFRPQRPASGTHAPPLEAIQDLPMGVSAAGGSGILKRGGEMRFWGVFGGTEDRTFDRREFCTYKGGDEQVAAPYRPGCPQGWGVSVVDQQESSLHWEMHSHYHGFDPGRYGLGANVTHGGTAREVVAAVAAFSAFDDDAPEVIENEAPVVEELDADATTLPPAMPAAPAPPPVARVRSARRVRGGRVRVVLGCPRGGPPCTGSIALGRRRPKAFRVPAGRTRALRLAAPRGKRVPVTLQVGAQALRFRLRVR